jgi:hypothetical protein
MSSIDRKVRELLDDVTRRMLGGNAADYAAYASLVARYRVLKELEDFLAEDRKTDADDGELTTDVKP